MDDKMKEILDRLSEVSAVQGQIISNLENQQKTLEKHTAILESQGQVLLRNTITVEEHHKRSTNLENRQDRLEEDFGSLKSQVYTEQANKQYLKNFFMTAGAILVGLPALGGILMGMYQLAKKLGL